MTAAKLPAAPAETSRLPLEHSREPVRQAPGCPDLARCWCHGGGLQAQRPRLLRSCLAILLHEHWQHCSPSPSPHRLTVNLTVTVQCTAPACWPRPRLAGLGTTACECGVDTLRCAVRCGAASREEPGEREGTQQEALPSH
jgi:hypothetical protein